MDDVVRVEGPVVRISGEFAVLVTLNEDSACPQFLKVVISDDLARMSRIELGDLVCLRSTGAGFKLQPVKTRSLS